MWPLKDWWGGGGLTRDYAISHKVLGVGFEENVVVVVERVRAGRGAFQPSRVPSRVRQRLQQSWHLRYRGYLHVLRRLGWRGLLGAYVLGVRSRALHPSTGLLLLVAFRIGASALLLCSHSLCSSLEAKIALSSSVQPRSWLSSFQFACVASGTPSPNSQFFAFRRRLRNKWVLGVKVRRLRQPSLGSPRVLQQWTV